MIDKKGFVKLFDLNVPSMEHFDYYINQLAKTQKFKDIKNLMDLFEEAELSIPNLYEFRLQKGQEIIEFLKTTNAYNEMCYDMNIIDLPVSKSASLEEGIKYLSVDIRSANWISLKKYDPNHINELGDTYEEFLKKFGMPKVFIHSKYLRQFIFGNVNPKRQGKVQRNLIQEVVRSFSDEFQIECVRNDEVIFRIPDFESVKRFLSLDNSKFKIKVFTVERVEDFRIDTIYSFNGNKDGSISPNSVKELVGVDGTKFYMKFKEYITKESLDVRDLYFRSNNQTAVWLHDSLELKLKNNV